MASRDDVVAAFSRMSPALRLSLGLDSYAKKPTERTNLTQIISRLVPTAVERSVHTIKEVSVQALEGGPIDDRTYIMERVIQLASSLPLKSDSGEGLTNKFLTQLWSDLQHPPISYLAKELAYRSADGSNNNIMLPHIGAAGTPYARTVKPGTIQPIALPDPGLIYDSVMVRKKYREHPNKISSVLFYLATIIIHDLFRTSYKDPSISETSSYLDLSPLYGSYQNEQNSVRTFKDGKIKPDCFAEKRILGFPPGVSVLLICFNRFHNYAVEQLAKIDENGRFSRLKKSPGRATASSTSEAEYDNALFQTGRLITCSLYINIVLKDYVRLAGTGTSFVFSNFTDYVRTILNLNRTDSLWDLDPRSPDGKTLFSAGAAEGTGNQVSAEFNLVYRWHSCISKKDEAWTEKQYAALLSQTPKSYGVSDFLKGVRRTEEAIPDDPVQRSLADLTRDPVTKAYQDDDLANILTSSIEDVAGAFGANQVPDALREVEILGILQARQWGLASLNEFRRYFNLEPYIAFEDLNPDPHVAQQLRGLYGHPDHVELYTGLVVEEAKVPMTPGSGLCPGFTISRAILSDAVALVRGDRFYTTDYSPKNLTNWGYQIANYDLTVDEGHVFYKLVLTALPDNYEANSIYAHYPLVCPKENLAIFTKLHKSQYFDFSPPTSTPNAEPPSAMGRERTRLILKAATEPTSVRGEQEAQKFYEDATFRMLHDNAYKIAGIYQLDLIRDVCNRVTIQYAASIFSLPLISEGNPKGVYGEAELCAIMLMLDPGKMGPAESFRIHQSVLEVLQQLKNLVLMNVEYVSKCGVAGNISRILHHRDELSDRGVDLIRQLLGIGLSPGEIVDLMLQSAARLVSEHAESFAERVMQYLKRADGQLVPEDNSSLQVLGVTSMFRVVSNLRNLRPVLGPQGELKKVSGPLCTLYMGEDQSTYWRSPTTLKVNWNGELPMRARQG